MVFVCSGQKTGHIGVVDVELAETVANADTTVYSHYQYTCQLFTDFITAALTSVIVLSLF